MLDCSEGYRREKSAGKNGPLEAGARTIGRRPRRPRGRSRIAVADAAVGASPMYGATPGPPRSEF